MAQGTYKWFDVILIIAIIASVLVVFLESVKEIGIRHGQVLYIIEWAFTVLFTIEYILRFYTVRHSSKYALSFYGIVDLLAILPTYISLIIPGSQHLIVIRVLRVLRIFRILKLSEYITEAHVLSTALKASRRKISVFLLAVITLVIIIGSLMYLIEGEKSPTNNPTRFYDQSGEHILLTLKNTQITDWEYLRYENDTNVQQESGNTENLLPEHLITATIASIDPYF